MKYHQQALVIRLAVFGEKDPQTALSFQNLGCLATQAGQYAAARALFEKSLEINRELLGEQAAATAISLDNLGMVAAETGDFSTALADLQQALAIQMKAFGSVHAETTNTLCDLGRLAERMGDYTSATKYYALALSNTRQLRGDKHPEVAHLLHSLGLIAECAGDYHSARNYLEQALAIRRAVLGDKHIDTGVTLSGLAGVAADLGDFKTALNYYDQALERYRKAAGEAHPFVASAHANIAMVQAEAGDWDAAAESMQQARRIARRYVARTLSGLSEKDQLSFLQLNHNAGLYCALSLGVARPRDQRLAVASATWLLNGKAVADEALSERTRLIRNANDQAAARLSKQLISVRSQLSVLSLEVPTPATQSTRQAELAALADEEQSLSRQLGAMGTEVEKADPWVSLDDVRRNLAGKAVLLDFALLPLRDFTVHGADDEWKKPHYVVWVVPPFGRGGIEVVDLGPAQPIEVAVADARRAIQSGHGNANFKGLELMAIQSQNGAQWQASLAALAKLIASSAESVGGFRLR